jgi:alkanesulfonate monooxygenase SsuD/methylene tetrahydromethanopterin reductase-like flavin-dependent oxidoreductase (luciferase family)
MEVETPIAVGKIDPGLREPDVKLDLGTVYERTAQLEALGYDGLVQNETKEDPFVVLPVAAQATDRVSLTTAVAIAFPRSPTVTALDAQAHD